LLYVYCAGENCIDAGKYVMCELRRKAMNQKSNVFISE